MIPTTEPFFSAEVEYRQQRLADLYQRHPKRHHWVPRRPSLKLPHRRRRPLAVA